MGAECLSRGPAGTLLESASALFGFARAAGTVCSLDRACIVLGIRHAAALGSGLLFLNVHPETLKNDVEFPVFLRTVARQYNFPLDRVVLERTWNILQYKFGQCSAGAQRLVRFV